MPRDALTFALAFLIARAAIAGAPANETPVAQQHMVTLASALELGLHNNIDLSSKATLVSQAEARQEQARAASFPKVIGTAILSPIYSVTGNALSSETDLRKWGVWVQSTVTILQPLYT